MNWSEFKQQVERWLYNFGTLFSFFTQFISSTAGDATWSYRKEDGTIEDKTVPNIMKIREGDANQRLKVADAVNSNEAVAFGQLLGGNWIDVTSLRDIGVTYTNTTNKPILLSIVATAKSGYYITLVVDNDKNNRVIGAHSGGQGYVLAFVPPGKTYYLGSNVESVQYFIELR